MNNSSALRRGLETLGWIILGALLMLGGILLGRSAPPRTSDIPRTETFPSAVTTNTAGPAMKFTAANYSGNLADYGGGNTLCEKEYPGFKMCRDADLAAGGGSLPDPLGYLNPFIGGWISLANNPSGANCGDWQNKNAGARGTRVYTAGSISSRWWSLDDGVNCTKQIPVCCYRATQ